MGQRQLVPARRLHPVARAACSVGLATVEFPRLRAAWATVSGCGARPPGVAPAGLSKSRRVVRNMFGAYNCRRLTREAPRG